MNTIFIYPPRSSVILVKPGAIIFDISDISGGLTKSELFFGASQFSNFSLIIRRVIYAFEISREMNPPRHFLGMNFRLFHFLGFEF